ncbi:MAG: ABC transporter permease [Acidobacteriota bacterium]
MLRRFLLTIPVIFGTVTLVFSLIHWIPGDPVEVMLGEGARSGDREELRHLLGLDRPLGIQYVEYLGNLVRGNLGDSIHFRQPVKSLIIERYPATVKLALCSMLVALLIAIPTGVLAAWRKGSAADHFSTAFALAGVSIPNFWLGPLLILLFSIHWNLLPVSGMEDAGAIILPALTLGTALAALLTRMIRVGLLEELGQNYIAVVRAKGVSSVNLLWKHALTNALIPVITILGLQFGVLLTGAIITEIVFAWPGLGRLLIQAIHLRDYPLLQGCVLAISLTYIGVNLLTDIAYGYLDPRIKYTE